MDALEKGSGDPSYVSALSGTGPIQEFEEVFCAATGAKHALALSSCTAALHTALMALKIGPGDEVIVTPYTWGQSVSPVLFAGATAVFADINPKTLTMDPESVEKRISKRTKAIIPVHMFGNPADMDSLCFLAKKHGLTVVSDAAQAYGALSKCRKLGGLGDVACFSLGRGKAVSGGEGGVLTTNNKELYQRAVAVSQHPLRAFREIFSRHNFYFMDELGWNYRIHPLACVLAMADLKFAFKRVARRKDILNLICLELKSIPFLKPIQCLHEDSSAAYGIPLNFESQSLNASRKALVESLHLKGINIQTGPVRTPIHLRPTFQKGSKNHLRVVPHFSHQNGSCPVAECRCSCQELLLFSATELDEIDFDLLKYVLSQFQDLGNF